MSDFLVIRPGTPVTLTDGIPAIVIPANLMLGDQVMYQCVWWRGRERVCEWLNACELPPQANEERMQIGFLER